MVAASITFFLVFAFISEPFFNALETVVTENPVLLAKVFKVMLDIFSLYSLNFSIVTVNNDFFLLKLWINTIFIYFFYFINKLVTIRYYKLNFYGGSYEQSKN